MRIVIEISSYDKEWITNGYYIPEEINMRISEAIANGTPLPEGAEILTKEAYSDLCRRAANVPDTNVGYMDCIKDSTTDSSTTNGDSSTDSTTVEPEKCEDCISRELVLSTYADWYGYGYNNGFYRLVQQMESVEPERPTGSWITDGVIDEDGNINCRCSQCKHSDVHSYDKFVPFCWACGAKMMEVINDTD